MDVLFRLRKDQFADKSEVIKYFKEDIRNKDDNVFYATKNSQMKELEAEDEIYFLYDRKIIAKATFTGEKKENKNRDENFFNGFQLKNIDLIDSDEEIDENIFKEGQWSFQYIKNSDQEKAIEEAISNKIVYPDEVENSYQEGAKKRIFVNAYERNPKARRKCIEKYGYKCSVCGFDFEKTYGKIGKNFIHVHHITPISSKTESYKVDPIKDLRPVCPNCHAMLHKKNPPMEIDELKSILNK